MTKNLKIQRPSEKSYINRGVFNLVFCQSIMVLLIFLDSFFLILFFISSFFILKSIFIALKYFISVEECFYEDKKLHYTKTLFQKWIIRRFSVPILEVESIEDRGKKVMRKASNMWNVFYYFYYFKIHERVCLHMKNGKKYYIWNFVKSPSLTCIYDNSADSDEEFLESFCKLQVMFEEGKEDANFQNRLKGWEKIYLGEIEGRYEMVLQEMLQEEKVFLIQTENHFTVNAGEEAIQHLGMFQARKFEEMDFYKFYLDYLSNKEYENSRVRVADNGRDCKEVSMKQLKEDINKLRDEK